ncbi:hypothetical protein P153DRAFT_380452 [Dothidotthia symphoricarpi CBS 119687]|uniref:Uncharacterized protein n=1 Tax=Dothidotthia symphoricarpi CBS 119687 TaxID=1392245 RepID=A0A6A6ARN7_9PLEO|nr:uncharacterized protein P153DRAFT_380452 [Dothidotthia symphoricarpi CBS 119687]KAF2134642.1 hypothetical protein P153DRAFT_380452 [Dothidotthia symphoricarpi CBS 119687]
MAHRSITNGPTRRLLSSLAGEGVMSEGRTLRRDRRRARKLATRGMRDRLTILNNNNSEDDRWVDPLQSDDNNEPAEFAPPPWTEEDGLLTRRPFPKTVIPGRTEEIPEAIGASWTLTEEEKHRLDAQTQARFWHATRIMETTAGKMLPLEQRCTHCKRNGSACWVYTRAAQKLIRRHGHHCARCRSDRSKRPCNRND